MEPVSYTHLVYRHLKRNKDVIYKEDLENLKLQKKDA